MTLILLTSLAVLATTSPAVSPDQIQMLLTHVNEADSNHDGMLTQAEWRTWRAGQFARGDRNHDNLLSSADLPAFARDTSQGAKLQQLIAEADRDHDGRVSRDELDTAPMPVFNQIDRDGNGVIDAYELKQIQGR